MSTTTATLAATTTAVAARATATPPTAAAAGTAASTAAAATPPTPTATATATTSARSSPQSPPCCSPPQMWCSAYVQWAIEYSVVLYVLYCIRKIQYKNSWNCLVKWSAAAVWRNNPLLVFLYRWLTEHLFSSQLYFLPKVEEVLIWWLNEVK